VLVPYDFSRAADAALAVGASLAAGRDGELLVVHAMAPVYTFTGIPGEAGVPSWTPPRELVDETRERVAAIVGPVAKPHRVGAVHCRVFIGDPTQVILQAARRADAIVMSTLGRTGLSHLVIGSIAEKIVRHSPVPVLTIGPKAARRLASPARKARRATRGRGRVRLA
jgi:nucleotide-binding universal stress UspA family protein